MKEIKILFISFLLLSFQCISNAQCNQSLTINSLSVECNGNGTSTVTINVTVLFGNGNNSATIGYDLGSGEVIAIVLEDDSGDIIDQTYTFDVPSCDNFSVILTAWTNPSGGGNSCSDPPPVIAPVVLPVEFAYVGVSQKDGNVIIDWVTYTQTNNEKFEVQRSNDNKDFITIGEVKGAGNSFHKINYKFVDSNILNGIYYYRIKQTDFDGIYSYSDVMSINLQNTLNLKVYPNPANEYISVISSNDDSFKLFNTLGTEVGRYQIISDNGNINISKLEPGLYFILGTKSSEIIPFVKL